MEEALLGIVTTINNYLSNYILIILLLGMGIWFTVRTKGDPVPLLRRRLAPRVWRLLPARRQPGRRHDVVPGALHRHRGPGGTGNIVGACGAIIVGGPGAIF